ncbi:hypothetical protein CSIM01_00126 [Colletotrichum simmondsii]|uniref:Uncharacterized protein n=1 Tax=Colletotrichum simmondsii TaxID=703756 RepID=A0A135SMB8_9PEZI|nr:hypothetical protein CSIM01_00126 [Colletotrichum simmondsii]
METKPTSSKTSLEFLNEIETRDIYAEPKHYVFLAWPRKTKLTDAAVAKCFADIIQPSKPDTFLCHWVNEEYLKHFAWHEKTPSPWEDSPKLIMLPTRLETARLGGWCQQQNVSKAPGFEAYTPRLVKEFQEMAEAKYGITGGNRALYLGLGILSYEAGGDQYKWPRPFLGCPQGMGVTWTPSGCQFWGKECPQQTQPTQMLLQEHNLVPSNTELEAAQQAQGQAISENLESDMTNLRDGLPSPSAMLPRELNLNIYGASGQTQMHSHLGIIQPGLQQNFPASPLGQQIAINHPRGLKRERDGMMEGVKAKHGHKEAQRSPRKRREM